MHILWLVSWYPSRVNFLNGDFVERHAKAAALFDNIYIIYVVKDISIKKVSFEVKNYSENLTSFIYYYPPYTHAGKLIEKIHSNIYYILLNFKAYNLYKKKIGKPKGILVQVAFKAGIIAVLLKLIYKVPFILFERWTGMLKEAYPNFLNDHIIKRWMWKVVAKKSKVLVTVTDFFGKQINHLHVKKPYLVIPNTVDEQLFFPTKKIRRDVFRFIHISTLDFQKNFEDILRAISIVRKTCNEIELIVYGPYRQHLIDMTFQLNLDEIIIYKGEAEHAIIAREIQQSDVLILYSRFETFGNVIIEANSCGVPVIVSDHPVFRETVHEKFNGIFVKGEDPEELARNMIWMIKNYEIFDPLSISNHTRKSYQAHIIGKLFHQLFHNNL